MRIMQLVWYTFNGGEHGRGKNHDFASRGGKARGQHQSIRSQGTITFQGLVSLVDYNLRNRFEGSIPWYVTTVKLDLEARGEIERIPGSKEQKLTLKRR